MKYTRVILLVIIALVVSFFADFTFLNSHNKSGSVLGINTYPHVLLDRYTYSSSVSYSHVTGIPYAALKDNYDSPSIVPMKYTNAGFQVIGNVVTSTLVPHNTMPYSSNYFPRPFIAECENGNVFMLLDNSRSTYSPSQDFMEVVYWDGSTWNFTSKTALFPYGSQQSEYDGDNADWYGRASFIGCVDNVPIVIYNAYHEYWVGGVDLHEVIYLNVARYVGGNWVVSEMEKLDKSRDIYNGSWIKPTSFVFDRVTNSYLLSYSRVNVTSPGLFARYISSSSNGSATQINPPSSFPVGGMTGPYPQNQLGEMFSGFQARDPVNGEWLGSMMSWVNTGSAWEYGGPFLTRWSGSSLSIDTTVGTHTSEIASVCVNEVDAPTTDLYVIGSGIIWKRTTGNTLTQVGPVANDVFLDGYQYGTCHYTGRDNTTTGDLFISYRANYGYLTVVYTGPLPITPTPTPTPTFLPGVLTLTANPATITTGSSSILEWTSANLTGHVLDHNIGSVPENGSLVVSPLTTTTYTIYGRDQHGVIMSAAATVQVTAATPTPTITPTITITTTPTTTVTTTPTVTPTPSIYAPTVTTNAEIKSITSNSAIPGGYVSADGGSAILERGIVYSSTQGTPTVNNADITATTGTLGPMEIGISGLSSNTTYYVRAYARNAAGMGYGEVVQFKTQDIAQATVPTVITGAVSGITLSQFSIIGNVTSDGGSPIIDRGFVYSSTLSSPTIGESTQMSLFGTTGQYAATIASLSANTLYHVRAYAVNDIGVAYGQVVNVRTTNTTNTNLPTVTTNSQTTNITYNSATTGGYVISEGSSAIVERGVVYSSIEHTPTTANASKIAVNGTLGQMTINLSSLSSNTTYYVRAFARNSSGTAYGASITFKTLRQTELTVPTVITENVVNITTTSFTVNGNVTADGGSAILERGFVYSTSQQVPLLGNAVKSIVMGTMGRYGTPIINLTVGKKYYVRAYARNAQGIGYGLILPVNTLDTIATPPDIDTNHCPTIVKYNITSSIAKKGDQLTLSWKVKNATSVYLSGFPASLKNEDALLVTANETKQYKLVAANPSCTVSKTITLHVVWIAALVNTMTPAAIVSLAEAGTFAMGMQGNIFTAMLGYVRRRKKGVGGIVYDAETKKPLPRVTLRLISVETDQTVDVTVTDNTGLFIFAPKKGKYKIHIEQRDYLFPSEIVKSPVDGEYEPIYRGDPINVENDNDLLRVAVPLDPLHAVGYEILRQRALNLFVAFLAFISTTLLVGGFAYSLYAAFTTPLTYNYIVVAIYLLMFVFKSGAFLSMKPVRGKVTTLHGKPLEGIEIGLYEPEFKTLIQRTFTKQDGTYTFIVENKDYYLEVLDAKYKIVQRKQGTLGVHSRKTNSRYPFRLVTERLVVEESN